MRFGLWPPGSPWRTYPGRNPTASCAVSVPGWNSDDECDIVDVMPMTPHRLSAWENLDPPDQGGCLSWAPHTGWAWTHKVPLHFRWNDGSGVIQKNFWTDTGQKKLFYSFEEALGPKTFSAVAHKAWQGAVGLNLQNQREFSWSTPEDFQHPAHHHLRLSGITANTTEFSAEVTSVWYAQFDSCNWPFFTILPKLWVVCGSWMN